MGLIKRSILSPKNYDHYITDTICVVGCFCVIRDGTIRLSVVFYYAVSNEILVC